MRLHLGVGPQFTGLAEDVNVAQSCLNIQYYFAMDDEISTDLWIYYCALQLKRHWRTIDPD